MAYETNEFVQDAIREANNLAIAYFRGKFLKARWLAEFAATIPNNSTEVAEGKTGEQIHALAGVVNGLLADYDASNFVELNKILVMSDLPLS